MSGSEKIDIDEESISEESTTIVVTDSEDYGETQKLKSIYRAKREVQRLRHNQESIVRESHSRFNTKSGSEIYLQKLSSSIAEYGAELLPIIEQAHQRGQLSDSDLETKRFDVSIRRYIEADGTKIDYDQENTEPYGILQSLAVYRQLNRILRDLGLGLDLEENKGPAEI